MRRQKRRDKRNRESKIERYGRKKDRKIDKIYLSGDCSHVMWDGHLKDGRHCSGDCSGLRPFQPPALTLWLLAFLIIGPMSPLGIILGNSWETWTLYAPPRSYTWLTLFAFNSPLSPIHPFLSFCLFNGPCSPTNLTHSAIVALTPRLGLIATQNPLPY
jgi:hypothetical protein